MKIAYFDCFSGAAGDMIVGSLLAAGADLEKLKQDLAPLGLAGVELHMRRLERQGITATKFTVVDRGHVEGAAELVDPHHHHHDHGHHHHDHDHHDHDHEHEHHHHRTLGDVEQVLQALPEPARGQAIAIFRRLAEAEARVHGTTAPFVHFHEVGMNDAIVDVAATVLCLQQLGVTEVQCSALPLGAGMVKCAHGTMPVPVPAVVELMAGFPSYDNGEMGELVTPTGAAILTTLATRFGPPPVWSLQAVGYGAGNREGKRIPNLVRVMLGTPVAAEAAGVPATFREDADGPMVEILANIDDLNPQLYSPLVERLLAAGAIDVTLTPTVMKKGRPGIVLAVLALESLRPAVSTVIFEETTTLGVRYHTVQRTMLGREFRPVATPWGEVSVKVGLLEGRVVNVAPEFEDVRRLAEAANVPVKQVWQAAVAAAGPGAWEIAGSLG